MNNQANKSPEKKISFLINSLKSGGAERVVSTFINELNNDYQVYLVLLENKNEFEINTNVNIIYLNLRGANYSLLKYIQLLTLGYRYSKLCKENKIDISFSFLSRSNYINIISKFFNNSSKIVISERTYISAFLKHLNLIQATVVKTFIKKLYPNADYIIANSKSSLADLQNNYNIKNPAVVIHNPVNIDRIENLLSIKPDFIFEHNIFYFIHVGNFRKEKNHILLLKAFANIINKKYQVKLLLIGEGDMQKEIDSEIINLNISHDVILLGLQKNPYQYIAKCNCLVLTSDFEGLPNVLLESLSCGVPMISTDCFSGPREILIPDSDLNKQLISNIEVSKYGILTPIKNIEKLTEAMELMINSFQFNYKKEDLKIMANSYDIKNIIKKMKSLINHLSP